MCGVAGRWMPAWATARLKARWRFWSCAWWRRCTPCAGTPKLGLREDPEPGPRRSGARVLALQRIGHVHTRAASLHVGQPQRACTRELLAQRGLQRSRQHHDAVLAALASAHEDGAVLEIDVLDAQAQAFGKRMPVP